MLSNVLKDLTPNVRRDNTTRLSSVAVPVHLYFTHYMENVELKSLEENLQVYRLFIREAIIIGEMMLSNWAMETGKSYTPMTNQQREAVEAGYMFQLRIIWTGADLRYRKYLTPSSDISSEISTLHLGDKMIGVTFLIMLTDDVDPPNDHYGRIVMTFVRGGVVTNDEAETFNVQFEEDLCALCL